MIHRQVNGFGKGQTRLIAQLCSVLPNFVEHDDGVIEREPKDGQESDDRRGGHFETCRRINAGGDHEIVDERGQGCDSHLPGAEVDRHHHDGEHDEDDEAAKGLRGDVCSPTGADERRRNIVLWHTVRVGQRQRDVVCFIVGELVRLHPQPSQPHRCHVGHLAGNHTLHSVNGWLLGSVSHVGDLELRATAELDAEVEPAGQERDYDRHGHQHQRDGIPDTALGNEVERTCTRVEIVSEFRQIGHQDFFPLDEAFGAAFTASTAFLSAIVWRFTASRDAPAAFFDLTTGARNWARPR